MSTTNEPPAISEIVAFMSRPDAYTHRPQTVQVVESHISWVFLTDRYAYKLKKPVRFEFLDFSTRELREQACRDELRLNRRLSPNVYVAVVAVTRRADGSFQIGGHSETVDWLVQMHRLPADRALDALLRENRLLHDDARTIARRLVPFYAQLPPEPITPESYLQSLNRHIRANAADLMNAPAIEHNRLRRIHAVQLRYLTLQRELLANRVSAGRIVDGHGDLRPEHIYLVDPLAVIDCLEFSAELRRVDIADELSFLTMECRLLGDGSVGEMLLAEYEKVSNDNIPPSLLAFYSSYRACVRAKVVLLRSQQQTDRQNPPNDLFQHYLELAERDAELLGPPVVLIVGGVMGTGKSTLAQALADAFQIQVLSSDRIRHALLGTSSVPAEYGSGNYNEATRQRIYEALFQQAEELLCDCQSVILDATFLSSDHRQRAYALAHRHQAVPLFVQCTCPSATAKARIEARREEAESESEARADLYDRQAREYETTARDEPAIVVDTTLPGSQQLEVVVQAMRSLLFDR